MEVATYSNNWIQTQYKKVPPRVRASSQYSLLYAPVAQMVEHEIFNFVVRGSIPFWRTIILIRRWEMIDIDDLIYGNESTITSER